MIEGLRLQISSTELVQIAQQRVEYHTKKAAWFESRAAEIGPELKGLAGEAQHQGKYSSNRTNLVEELNEKEKHHKDRATLFGFMAKHVIPNETYILTDTDLQRLEVVGAHRW